MLTIECDWQGFKHIAHDFFISLPTANFEEAEAGIHCFRLAHLGLEESMFSWQADLLLNLAEKYYADHLLLLGECNEEKA